LVLFNLQSAFVFALSSRRFSTRSLERLFIIPRRNPFVNTFFQKNSIFLKFSALYSQVFSFLWKTPVSNYTMFSFCAKMVSLSKAPTV